MVAAACAIRGDPAKPRICPADSAAVGRSEVTRGGDRVPGGVRKQDHGHAGRLAGRRIGTQAVRLQIPRVLRLIPSQRSVDILLRFIGHADLAMRAAFESFEPAARDRSETGLRLGSISEQIMSEARYYFGMAAALEAFREQGRPHSPAALLVSTLEERLKSTLERLFRLLGLKYPPQQMYAAYLAVRRGHDDSSAAMEFLDNVLERDAKRSLFRFSTTPHSTLTKRRDLFGIDIKDTQSALRELLRSDDEWLVTCAIATAAQLSMTDLIPGNPERVCESRTTLDVRRWRGMPSRCWREPDRD